MITAAKLSAFSLDAVPYWPGLQKAMSQFDINSDLRVAHFHAQLAHESAGFHATTENLNYSADALHSVFGKYFPTQELATQYARNPERIANRIYANRLGNGPEQSGDGWRFRGRGLIQVTGKNNYRAYSIFMYADDRAVSEPALLARDPDAVLSAGWFWHSRSINLVADRDDLVGVTKLINGGTMGMKDRARWLARAKDLIGIRGKAVHA